MAAWGFVGGAYEAANLYQDDQSLINWYVETDSNREAKSAIGLLGAPGLKEAVTTTYTGEVRGAHTMPGGSIAYLVIGATLVRLSVLTSATVNSYATFQTQTIGTLRTTNGQVSMRDNGVAGVLVIVDGSYLYRLTNTGDFAAFDDPNVSSPTRLAEIDGWIIFNSSNTQKFNTTPLYWNGTDPFDGTFFALKDNYSDNMVSLIEDKRELWLIGSQTSEVWYNAGSSSLTDASTQPFSRLQGAMLQIGCAAAQTVARTGRGIMWLANSERVSNTVILTQGYDYQQINNFALSSAISKYKIISDAFAYVYTDGGHEFYVLTFPSEDVTWVYDLTTDFWHQRQSIGADDLPHRQRANCFISFANQKLVGDYQTGQIWRQSREYFTDGDRPLIATRKSPWVWDGADRCRIRHDWLQIEFAPGVGLSSGQGSDPLMMLRWRDGLTWSNLRTIPIGRIGQYKHRAIARRLGASRNRIYEVSISDPVSRDIVGATLKATGMLS